jgi:CRISPR type I-E-associated protein CasA/Cse1
MNVLLDSWIPVTDAHGLQSRIAPVELPGSGAMRVAHPRADHCALLTELLVCIFQTLAAPRDERQKLAYLNGTDRPDADTMRAHAAAFELFGDGPRFLQTRQTPGESVSASYFAFEAPTGHTLTTNRDFFVSREAIRSVCPQCAATGLFLCQSHARMGGSGYRGGPRGTSALTALLEGRSLWQTVCLNLLTPEQFANFSNVRAPTRTPSFPWLSHPSGFERAPDWDDLGPYGVLWWTPVALRLNESENPHGLPCGLCGEIRGVHVTSVAKDATPVVPQGVVRHPHTGWREPAPAGDSNPAAKRHRPGPLPVEVPAEGFTAQTWSALVLGERLVRSLAAPLHLHADAWQVCAQLRMFGPATENNPLLKWLDTTAPMVFAKNDHERELLRDAASHLLNLASRAAAVLRSQLGPRIKIGTRRMPVPLAQPVSSLVASLWDSASTRFLAVITQLENGELLEEDARSFRDACHQVALRLFDENVLLNTYEPRLAAELLGRRDKLDRALRKA